MSEGTAAERIREDARKLVERTTKAQRLPVTVEDASALERIATMVRSGR
jgi:hypothetical protein